MKNLTKKLLATFMAGAMLIGAALPVLAAEDGEPCAHEGMASDSSYCSDCDTYYIKKQPISSDGYVSVYDIDNVESYQWYGYSEYELITDKTVYPRGNEKGEVSVYENGVWTPVLTENGNSYDRYSTFTFDELNSGDVVLINAYVILKSGYVYKLGAGDFEFENFHYGFTGSETYRNFSVAAELRGYAFDVTPTIRVNNSVAMGQDYELKIVAYRYDSVKAAGKLEKAMEADPELLPRDAYYSFYTAVEGQNGFMLTNGENSRNYFCRVTFKDGTVIDTDTILYSHKISKVPIAAAPSIKVTSGDDASYQWYRESYEVSLLSAGEGIYSYTLTPDKAERPIDISDSYYTYTYENVYMFRGTQAIITAPDTYDIYVGATDARNVAPGVYTYDVYDTGYYTVTVRQKHSEEPTITLLCTEEESERIPEPFSYVEGKGWAPVKYSAEAMSDYQALIDASLPELAYEIGYKPSVFSAFWGRFFGYDSYLELTIDYTGELDPEKFMLIGGSEILLANVSRYNGETRLYFSTSYETHYTLVYAGELGDDVYLNTVTGDGVRIVPHKVFYSQELGWQTTDGEYYSGYACMRVDIGELKAGEYYLIDALGSARGISPDYSGNIAMTPVNSLNSTDLYIYTIEDSRLSLEIYGYSENIGVKIYKIDPTFWCPENESPNNYVYPDNIIGYEIIEEIKPIESADKQKELTVKADSAPGGAKYTDEKGYEILPSIDNALFAIIPAGQELWLDSDNDEISFNHIESVFENIDVYFDNTGNRFYLRNRNRHDVLITLTASVSSNVARYTRVRQEILVTEKLEGQTGAAYTGEQDADSFYFVTVCWNGTDYISETIRRGFDELNEINDLYVSIDTYDNYFATVFDGYGEVMYGDHGYKWYEYTNGVTLTPELASPYISPDGRSTYYTALGGWNSVSDNYIDMGVVKVQLKKNDILVFGEFYYYDFDPTVIYISKDGYNEIYASDMYLDEDSDAVSYVLVPEDGEYTVFLSANRVNSYNSYRIPITLYRADDAVIHKGNDMSRLRDAKHKHFYRVDVTLPDGITLSAPTYFINRFTGVNHITPKLYLLSEAGVSFRWYKEDSFEGIGDNSPFDNIVTTYDFSYYGDDTRWVPADTSEGETSRFEFFKVSAKKGDVLRIYDTDGDVYGGNITILGPNGENPALLAHVDYGYYADIPADGVYLVFSSSYGTLSAGLDRTVLLEGETSSALGEYQVGNSYYCVYSMGEGHEERSDSILVDRAVISRPDIYDSTVTINTDEEVTYQWRISDHSEITPELATPFTSGETAAEYANGAWTSSVLSEDGNYYLFFSVKLNKGDEIYVTAPITVYYGTSDDYSAYTDSIDDIGTISIEESGVYSFVIDSSTISPGYTPSISFEYEYRALEGENGATLKSDIDFEADEYDVIITYPDGTELTATLSGLDEGEPSKLDKAIHSALNISSYELTLADKAEIKALYDTMSPYYLTQIFDDSTSEDEEFMMAFEIVCNALTMLEGIEAKAQAISDRLGAYDLDSVNEGDLADIDALTENMDWIEFRLTDEGLTELAALRATASALRAKAAATPAPTPDSGEDNEGEDSENTPDDPEGSQGGDVPAGDAPATAPEESGETVTDEPEEAPDDTAAGGLGAGAVIAIAIGAAVVGAGAGVGISLGVSAKKAPKSKKTEE